MNQLELETWWVNLYRSNGVAQAQKLRRSGRASSDSTLRHDIKHASLRIAKRLNEMLGPRGNRLSDNSKYISKLLESIEPLALAHLVVCGTINNLLSDRSEISIPQVGNSLASVVELELKIRFIEQVYPELMKGVRKRGGTFVHQNRAAIHLAGRSAKAGLPGFFADRYTRDQVGMALVEMLLLDDGPDRMFVPYLMKRGKSGGLWCLKLREKLLDKFNREQTMDDFLTFVPPLGLYLSPPPLDRGASHDTILNRRPIVTPSWLGGHNDKANVPGPILTRTLEHLNRVGYKVNSNMLAWISSNLNGLAARGIITPVELRLRNVGRGEAYRTWHDPKNANKRRVLHRALTLARKLDGITFHHDWFSDYRGRMYTTSSLLSPQGNPLNKALIEFSETVEIRTPLSLYERPSVAYLEFLDYGLRMVHGKADIRNLTLHSLRDIINHALDGSLRPEQLNDEKDYLPFVAWCFPARELLERGYTRTGIMLRRDATASSIQHMAIMAKDVELMGRVNLSDRPVTSVRDLYSEIDTAPSLSRKSLKAFIMTFCYNSTAYGRVKAQRDREGGAFRDLIQADKLVESALTDTLALVADVRDAIGSYGEAHGWRFESPSGVCFDGGKYEYPSKCVYVRFNGARMRVRLKYEDVSSAPLNRKKTASAYVANVIHSLDAAQLHLSSASWPRNVATIHDCIVTLPGSMGQAVQAVTEAFFTMHKNLHDNKLLANYTTRVDTKLCLRYDEFTRCSSHMFV